MFHHLAGKLGIVLLVLVTAFLGACAGLATWTVLDGRPAVEAHVVLRPGRLPTQCGEVPATAGGARVL